MDTPKPEKWAKSKAKAMLKEALLSGAVLDSMKPREVFEMHPAYQQYKYENFRTNLNTIGKSLKAGRLNVSEKTVTKWKKSEAKRLLRDDIISGVVDDSMPARDVYQMHEIYHDYKFENFSSNLKSLRESIRKNIKRMQFDCLAYAKDQSCLIALRRDKPCNLPPYPIWYCHEAKKLKQDVDDGKHIGKKPMQLWESRPAYQDFPLKVFRKHIYQELDERASREIRFGKKKHRFPALKPAATKIEHDKIRLQKVPNNS